MKHDRMIASPLPTDSDRSVVSSGAHTPQSLVLSGRNDGGEHDERWSSRFSKYRIVVIVSEQD